MKDEIYSRWLLQRWTSNEKGSFFLILCAYKQKTFNGPSKDTAFRITTSKCLYHIIIIIIIINKFSRDFSPSFLDVCTIICFLDDEEEREREKWKVRIWWNKKKRRWILCSCADLSFFFLTLFVNKLILTFFLC